MKKFDMSKITRSFNKVGFTIKKYSPEILVGSGVVGTVAASVMACKATTKAGDIVDNMKEQMEEIHSLPLNEEIETKSGEIVVYTEEDLKKDTAIVYAKTGLEFVKLYGPAVLLGVASITSILKGHSILRKRNLALAAAYATIDKGFKEYRDRVIERFGKDLDKELRYNVKAKEFEEVVIDKNGKEKVEKKVVNVADPSSYSDYARFFDDGCTGWTKDPEVNLKFLKMQNDWATEKLKTQGYLFLNDVYEMLGIPKTKAGFVVGWIYDEKNPIGDNFVDFGIYDTDRETCRNFVNGYERTILLDFNVDGNILDMM